MSVISPRLQPHLANILELWDELSSFGVHDCDIGARLCMERICLWLGAQNAFWVGAVHVEQSPRLKEKDVLYGWRIRMVLPLHPQHHDVLSDEQMVARSYPDAHPGAANIALVAGAGVFRAYTLQSGKLVDVNAFQQTDHYDFNYRRRSVCDRIWVAFPVNADAETFFCFDRISNGQHFNEDDLDLAAFTLRGIKWFHHQLLLSYGIGLYLEPPTPAERRVIRGLLAGGSEKAIAAELNLSQGTVHQYATRVYRKFGVQGRSKFTALWLSGSS